MFYCVKCREEHKLPKTAAKIYDQTCECCGKKFTTCHWNPVIELIPEWIEPEEEGWEAILN